jgi:hypothetical protein
VFLNSDKFIDFYLEDGFFITKTTPIKNRLLTYLRRDFHKCLNPNTRSECIYKTVRTHFVDTRQKKEGSHIIRTAIFGRFKLFLTSLMKKTSMNLTNLRLNYINVRIMAIYLGFS